MPERLECEVLQKARYINTVAFTFVINKDSLMRGALCSKLHAIIYSGRWTVAVVVRTPL